MRDHSHVQPHPHEPACLGCGRGICGVLRTCARCGARYLCSECAPRCCAGEARRARLGSLGAGSIFRTRATRRRGRVVLVWGEDMVAARPPGGEPGAVLASFGRGTAWLSGDTIVDALVEYRPERLAAMDLGDRFLGLDGRRGHVRRFHLTRTQRENTSGEVFRPAGLKSVELEYNGSGRATARRADADPEMRVRVRVEI